jgi:hypothetical protein
MKISECIKFYTLSACGEQGWIAKRKTNMVFPPPPPSPLPLPPPRAWIPAGAVVRAIE